MACDHLFYCDLVTDRPQRVYDIVHEHNALTVARVGRRNFALSDALRPIPDSAADGWAWVYNTAASTPQNTKNGTDAMVLKANLSLNWTGPYEVLAVGPCSYADTPHRSRLGAKLLYLDFPPGMPGAGAHRRVSVQRCKPCAPTPTSVSTRQSVSQRGWRNMCSLTSPRPPPPRGTTPPKTTFQLLFNDSTRRRSPGTNRSVDEVGLSR